MEGFRVAPRPFIADGRLYGSGRFHFGGRVYNSWIIGSTLPDDPAVPAGHSEIIPIEGLQVAYDRLNTWTRNQG